MDQLHRDIIALAGTMTRKEIADSLRTSRATVNRCLRDNGIKTGQPKQYPIEIREAVIAFYATHNKYETQKQFPGVRVRSIIERYETKAKQKFWTFEEDLKAISMLTETSTAQIAKVLKRGEKSAIKRISRKYNISPKHLNGMAYRLCKHVMNSDYVPTKKGNAYIVDWKEFDKYLDTTNKDIIECVKVLAKFRSFLCQISQKFSTASQ